MRERERERAGNARSQSVKKLRTATSTSVRRTPPTAPTQVNQRRRLRMATQSPYSRPAPILCKCVANRTTRKAVNYTNSNGDIKVENYQIKSQSAVSDGTNSYLVSKNGEEPELVEGCTYILKNVTLGTRYGRKNVYFGRTSNKFRTAPLNLDEMAEKVAREAIYPPSVMVTGEEDDLFTRGDYLSLKGEIEKIQPVRMTYVQGSHVPILDLTLRCGQKLLEVSLWRDEALCELYLKDEVELTHLKIFLLGNGRGKLNSSSHTAVKTAERKVVTEYMDIIGVSEENGNLTLLCSNFEEFSIPEKLYNGRVVDLIAKLPTKVKIQHTHNRVLDVEFAESES